MARGLFRKPSLKKTVGAYRSQWKRSFKRLFIYGYGKKGVGWWRNPKKAWYNFWYHRTSISIPRALGYRPSPIARMLAMSVATLISLFSFPIDLMKNVLHGHKRKKSCRVRMKQKQAARKATSQNGVRSKSKAMDITRESTTGTTRGSTAGTTRGSTTSTTRGSTAGTARESTTGTTRGSTTSTTRGSTAGTTRESTAGTTRGSTTGTTRGSTARESASARIPKPTPREVPITQKKEQSKSPAPPFTPIRHPEVPKPTEQGEDVPKSAPKHTGDEYVRKRMTIAGASYCDRAVLEKLTVGVYFDLVAEPDNPYDKNAVMLSRNGEKIGYVPRTDSLAIATSLRLNRRPYGVITEIDTETVPMRYEFEIWFEKE